jgi:Uncharacterized protein conserved in bacteria
LINIKDLTYIKWIEATFAIRKLLMRYCLHIISIFLIVTCSACRTKNGGHGFDLFDTSLYDTKQIIEKLHGIISTKDVNLIQVSDSNYSILHTLYSSDSAELIWTNEDGIHRNAQDYLIFLNSLQYEGLNPEEYGSQKLDSLIKYIYAQKKVNAELLAIVETSFTSSAIQSIQDVVYGKYYYQNNNYKDWLNKNDTNFYLIPYLKELAKKDSILNDLTSLKPNHLWYSTFAKEYKILDSLQKVGVATAKLSSLKDTIVIGYQSNEILVLRKRLFAEQQIPADTISNTWNEDLVDAIKLFQTRYQLKPSGKLDSATLRKLNLDNKEKLKLLALNMERLRWLTREFTQPYIWAVTPKMDVEYIEDDSVQFRMRSVVGRPSRPTPTLDTKLENIVFSPPWIVPPTIMREEIVPGIARRGGAYLARRGLKAYDRRGRVVKPSTINSTNIRNFSIGQAPGYRSSLGEVKFNMPNPWSIYMHDTPHRKDFLKSYRAYSSGCVRVDKPKEFASFLLQNNEQYSYEKVDSICKLRKTISVPITRDIKVHIVYLTTALDTLGNVVYLKDIYGWDKLVKGI